MLDDEKKVDKEEKHASLSLKTIEHSHHYKPYTIHRSQVTIIIMIMTTRVGAAQFCGILRQRLLAPTVDIAHQHLHPGPAEDSVRAHVNEETTLPRVLAVDEKESPQALLPACPVDVYSDQQSLQI